MAMQILRLRLMSDGKYRTTIWLDTSKTVGPNPDPVYTRTFEIPPLADGLTEDEHLDIELDHVRLVCDETLAMIDATEGPALTREGDTLDPL